MEQNIRFCRSGDGCRIAYAVTGSGPALVRSLGWFTHLEYEWETPYWRNLNGQLERAFTLVRYDGRGRRVVEEPATYVTPAASGLVTILFTDMEGSTALTQRLGDVKAQEVLRAHNSVIRDALKKLGGREIKNVVRELTLGKGFQFAEIGEFAPKGFAEAVRLHEVRWTS